jgi:hypothetical protein
LECVILRREYAFILFFSLGLMLVSIPFVNGENEPNDSLMAPENIGEGTVTGTVSINALTTDDLDYYRISVPKGKDLQVKATKTDAGTGSITIRAYDHNKEDLGIFGIYILLTASGETETDSWYNGDGFNTDLYLEVKGEGDYEITIDFTSDTEEAVQTLAGICFLGTAGMICIPIATIILIIIIIIVIVKLATKKKK